MYDTLFRALRVDENHVLQTALKGGVAPRHHRPIFSRADARGKHR